MICLQFFKDEPIFFCKALMNTSRYYNFVRNFSFAKDFNNHSNFIFRLHPKLITCTDLTTFFRYLFTVLTCLLSMQVPLFVSI